jgi:hypothetical protein
VRRLPSGLMVPPSRFGLPNRWARGIKGSGIDASES